MAKRSITRAIPLKQSSAYKGVIRVPEAIQAIDGSSKREISRRSQPALRSWTLRNNYVDEAMLDAQAEKQMNPHGWTKRRNPICSSCYVQKSLSGSCGCTE